MKGRPILLVLCLCAPLAACAGGGVHSGSGGSGGATGAGTGGASVDLHPDEDGAPADDRATDAAADGGVLPRFSFFVTSLEAMQLLSGSQAGFGGDLRDGEASGLAGADKICSAIAEMSMPGARAKTWRAFLSTVDGPVHAIDRIGDGPWYDRLGRLVAMTRADLLHDRPAGADPAITDDLPNEDGVPNHSDGAPGCIGHACPDNHDILTGTNNLGQLFSPNPSTTCNDWSSGLAQDPGGAGNGPRCGHSWPRDGSGVNWMSSLAEGGCGPGVNLQEGGGPPENVFTVGAGGGYGGIYCFALTP
ncbi:MAG TPA: hypothetical protein VGL59_13580 [Polyangia bacterium]|jgi:hypothetical protein